MALPLQNHRSCTHVAASVAAMLLLLLVAAAAPVEVTPTAIGPRRNLLNKPCCSDCESRGNDVAVFNCFQNCRQDCVSGSQCLQLSRDVAGRVASAACSYAVNQCSPQRAQAAAAFQVTRPQCYRAAKNVCISYGRDYARSGSGSCSGYVYGLGSCDAGTFRRYTDNKLNDLCDSVGRGISISLP